jgi:xanthine dehydrogenase accessory factor
MTSAWPHHGLDNDLRTRIQALRSQGAPFALATVFAADSGPRGVGAQMVVTAAESWGFVSGGCIESDVAMHGRAALADGAPRHLVYGQGSPWIDIRLPCGGRLDLLVERITPDDPAIAALLAAGEGRAAVRYQSDGERRRCVPLEDGAEGWIVDAPFTPPQRLIVIGSDPIALATAALGARLGWEAVLVWPNGPAEPPGLGVTCRRDDPDTAIKALVPDAWTAVAVATHDADEDLRSVCAALAAGAGYVGVLGARRRIPERVERLRAAGVAEADIARVRMPLGLAIAAATPWEIAASIVGEIIAMRRER